LLLLVTPEAIGEEEEAEAEELELERGTKVKKGRREPSEGIIKTNERSCRQREEFKKAKTREGQGRR
jgi:hypothetical protein